MHRINLLAWVQLESLPPNRIGNAVMAFATKCQEVRHWLVAK